MVTILNDEQYDFRPDASTSYDISWKVMKRYFVELLVIILIYSFLSGPISTIKIENDHFGWYMAPLVLFGMLYGLFVAGPINYGTSWAFLKAIRGERIEIGDIFKPFQRNYMNVVVANLVVMIIVGLGVFMLIVPGIIFACRLAFVPYLVMDRNMDAMEALRVSWDMTRGYGWQIFTIGLLAFFVALAGLLALVVGIFISMIVIQGAFAAMYHAVVLKNGIPEQQYNRYNKE